MSAQVVEGTGCVQLDFSAPPGAGPGASADEAPGVELDQRLILTADELLLEDDGLSNLAGMVKLRQGDKTFTAEALSFDDQTRVVTVDSESVFRNRDLIIRSRQARFDLNAESGAFMDTEFTLPSRGARGRADEVQVRTDGEARLLGAVYTTCAPQSDAWYVEAANIRLDHESGLGSARGARLRFMRVPILYLPYIQFPIDDRRRSGLLFPTVGQLSGSGIDLRWPVYINLAPNYDATFTPRLLSDRGLQPGLDFRYLLARSGGTARYEYLDDRKFGQDRSLFRFDHLGRINRRLGLEATYSETSDRRYFEDLGGNLRSASITHLEQTAQLTYQAPAAYTVHALVQNFQPISTNLLPEDDPYKRLPQIRFEALTKNAWNDTRLGIDAEFVNFSRDRSVEGVRLNLAPYLQLARQTAAWYTVAQADLRYTGYELSGIPAQREAQIDRTLPVISAEGGLVFDRITDDGRLQQFTPRLFGLFVPFDNQDELPLFDTGEPDFDFVQLFARNRFSGEDRLADARHLAGAATLRELDPASGQAQWSASIGQLFRFEAPRVDIPDFPAPEQGATEFIAQFDYRVNAFWSTVLAGQWAPEESQFERSQLGLRYRDGDRGRQLDLAYRYRRDLLEQADFSFLAPVGNSWKLAARTRFSLLDNRSRENFLGVEYGTCCWAVRTSWRRFVADTSGEIDSGVYVQLQLKGLARIGAGADTLLPAEESNDGIAY